MRSFSAKTRDEDLKAAASTHFDLLVVGGGITGAGVLRDAAMRGLKTLCLEKNDFASGTSSKSSKLVHGGLRYLKQFDFQMTRESCVERNLLVQQNPHLVEPIPFLYPIYKSDKQGPFLVRLGMIVYETLSSFQNHRMFRMLKPADCQEHCPDINMDGLRGAAYYYDASVDDARLVIESAKSGVREGGWAFNRIMVTGLIKDEDTGQLRGVHALDLLSGERHSFTADVILNATGAWVDGLRAMDSGERPSVLRPTKGVHLIVPKDRLRQNCTLAFNSVQDRRLMFSIPWGDVTLIGTTDTDYDGDKDTVTATMEDVDYILEATNHAFPGTDIGYDDVLSTFAGLRPLVANPDADDPGAVSREHEIFQDPSGLISIAGGKLTTYRLMARELVDLVVSRMDPERRSTLQRCTTHEPICGEPIDVEEAITSLVDSEGFAPDIARHLIRTYGPAVDEVLTTADSIKEGRERITPDLPYLRGETAYAVRFEGAVDVGDVLTRRLRAAIWSEGQGLSAAEPISRLIADELGFSEEQRLDQVKRYRRTVAIHHRPVPTPSDPSDPSTTGHTPTTEGQYSVEPVAASF